MSPLPRALFVAISAALALMSLGVRSAKADVIVTLGANSAVAVADESILNFGLNNGDANDSLDINGIFITNLAGSTNFSGFDPTFGASTAGSFDRDASLAEGNFLFVGNGPNYTPMNFSLDSGDNFYAISMDAGAGVNHSGTIIYQITDADGLVYGGFNVAVGETFSIADTKFMSQVLIYGFYGSATSNSIVTLDNYFIECYTDDPTVGASFYGCMENQLDDPNNLAVGGLEIENNVPPPPVSTPEPAPAGTVGTALLVMGSGAYFFRRRPAASHQLDIPIRCVSASSPERLARLS